MFSRVQGLFDQSRPPQIETPVYAVELLTGQIYYDLEARMHIDVITNLHLDLEQVKDGGFIVQGRYITGSKDAAKLAAEAREHHAR